MKKEWTLSSLRIRDGFALLLGFYIVNYIVTPLIVGSVPLESHYRPHFNESFEKAVWMSSNFGLTGGEGNSSYGRRYRMVDNLILSHLPGGMETQKVREILGNPDAGIIDKVSLLSSSDPYGSHKLNPAKEILESTDDIAIWAYHLGSQREFPARSIWFPKLFPNVDRWKLVLKMRNGRLIDSSVVF